MIRCAYIWGGKKCSETFDWDDRYGMKAIIWLLRAHWWEQHDGNPPEGLP